jgi:hypothetical protein
MCARLGVVLDSNVYRCLGEESFAKLLRDERHHSIVAYANYYVVTELLTHLYDDRDPDYASCVAALRRLGIHSGRRDGNRTSINFMQLPDAQIARILFGVQTQATGSPGIYSEIVGRLLDGEAQDVVNSYRNGIAELRERVAKNEAQFSAKLWERVVLTLQPGATSWNQITRSPLRNALLAAIDRGQAADLVAATIVDRAATRSGLVLSEASRQEAVGRALRAFPTAVQLHVLMIRRLIEKGPDMTRPNQANTIWDYEITFSTGPGATVQGVPLILVTNDPLITRAAEIAGMAQHYWSWQDYSQATSQRESYIDVVFRTRAA